MLRNKMCYLKELLIKILSGMFKVIVELNFIKIILIVWVLYLGVIIFGVIVKESIIISFVFIVVNIWDIINVVKLGLK